LSHVLPCHDNDAVKKLGRQKEAKLVLTQIEGE
jgi:hypothetical protein